MAIDTVLEAPSPSPSPSRHFYLAVDRLQFKLQTVVDLLGLVGRRACLPIVVCCSTRDDLDSLCSARSSLPFISSSPLYSDLAEDERASVLDKFRQVTTRWSQVGHSGAGNEDEDGKDDDRSHMIIVTDACLPLLASGESPLNAHLLINYELPAKKEAYGRRLAACLTADGIVINMVVGGEVVTLKSIEESSSIVMQEMPMQVSLVADFLSEEFDRLYQDMAVISRYCEVDSRINSEARKFLTFYEECLGPFLEKAENLVACTLEWLKTEALSLH